MAETDLEFSHLQTALDLLESVGFEDARKPGNSSSEKLASGIAWSIATINGANHHCNAVSDETQLVGNKIDVWERIGEDLKSIGCPFPLQASHVQQLDDEAVFSVVQWLASRIRVMSEDSKSQGTSTEHLIEEKDCLQPLQPDINNAGVSIKILNDDCDELNQKKVIVLKELQCLQERIFEADANHVVQNLVTCSKTLEDIEKQKSEFLSTCNTKRYELENEILELEGKLARGCGCSSFINSIDHSICESQEEINKLKKALASRLRATLALQRRVDDVPTQSELIQYERRFSELYVSIQGKLRQTRRYYATYNALLDIKDLMVKETSLLNSISSQFQDAITSSTSQLKLIDSLEGILKGTCQKLDKVQLSHQEEQRVCNALKERDAAATAEQRRSYILLKAFQEECARNERLRIQTSM